MNQERRLLDCIQRIDATGQKNDSLVRCGSSQRVHDAAKEMEQIAARPAWRRAVLQLSAWLEGEIAAIRQGKARGTLGGPAFPPLLPFSVAAEERQCGCHLPTLDWATPPRQCLDWNELGFRSHATLRGTGADRCGKGRLPEVCCEHHWSQARHPRA